MERDYSDIINLPYRKSNTHPHMAVSDRAAQFAPFAALTGYDDAIRETARLTDEKQVLDEETAAELDLKIEILRERISEKPQVEILYFAKDDRKSGGKYVTVKGWLRKIDEVQRKMILDSGAVIDIADIAEIKTHSF